MIGLALYAALFLVILGLLYTLLYWIKSEVTRQLDGRDLDEARHLEAVHEIKDEMRRSSHRLLAAAINPRGGDYDVLDADEIDRQGE